MAVMVTVQKALLLCIFVQWSLSSKTQIHETRHLRPKSTKRVFLDPNPGKAVLKEDDLWSWVQYLKWDGTSF